MELYFRYDRRLAVAVRELSYPPIEQLGRWIRGGLTKELKPTERYSHEHKGAMQGSEMEELIRKFELAEKAIIVLTKLSFALGSVIFLVYCARNGGFPDNLSLADSLRIFYIVTVFSLGTLTVYFFLMCLGLSICHLIYRIANVPQVERMLLHITEGSRVVRRQATKLRRAVRVFPYL